MSWRAMEVSMSITRRGKYTDSNICMNVQVCDVACLFFLLYANLLVLVTLCEGNHYPFIEERYTNCLKYKTSIALLFVVTLQTVVCCVRVR